MSSLDKAKVIVEPVHDVHVLLNIGDNARKKPVLQDGADALSSVPGDLSLSCVKIVPQIEGHHMQPLPLNLEDIREHCDAPCSRQGVRPQVQPNQDDVLSVVIQKLTELVESSDNRRACDRKLNYSGSSTPKSIVDGTDEVLFEQPKSKGKCKLFKCPNCPCLFSVTKAQLRRKVRPVCPCCEQSKSVNQMHGNKPINEGLIACDLCNAIFSSYSDVLLHLGTHTNATIFKCRLCDYVTTQEKQILKHETVHFTPPQQQKSFKCVQCNDTFSDFAKLQNHMKTHNKNKELLMKCSDCGFTCRCEDILRKHMWQHMESKSNLSSDQNPQCALLKGSVTTSQEETKSDMLCRIKGSVCPMQDGWQSQVCLYKCPLCSYICEKLSTLKCHVWRHAGDKKCAYPLIDDVESLKEAVIPIAKETNDTIDVEGSEQTKIVVGCCVDTGKNCCEKRNGSGCRCEAITVSKEQYPIIENIIDNPDSILQSTNESSHSDNFNVNASGHTVRIGHKVISQVVESSSSEKKKPANESGNESISTISAVGQTCDQVNTIVSSKLNNSHNLPPTSENSPYCPTDIQLDNTTPVPEIFYHFDGDIVTQNAEVVVSETVEISMDELTETEKTENSEDFVPHKSYENVQLNEDGIDVSKLYNYKFRESEQRTIVGEEIDNVDGLYKEIGSREADISQSQIFESLLKKSQTEEKMTATPINDKECTVNNVDSVDSGTDDEVEQLSIREEVVGSSPSHSFSIHEGPPQSEKPGISDSLLCVIENLVQRSNKDVYCQSQKSKRKRKRHENELVDNVEDIKSSKNNFQCEHCSYKTTSSGYMHRHMKYHIANKPNQCPLCSFQANDAQQLETHMIQSCKTPVHSCNKCSAKFFYKSKLLVHMRTHATLFKCAYCSFETNSENDVEEHRLFHQNHQDSDTATYKTEAYKISNTSQFVCKECNMIVSNPDDLESHVKVHMKLYKCQLCDYSSATANGVKNHMKFHLKDRPHKCPLCEFSGAYPQSLRAHMKSHMQEYNFSLPAANEVFKCKLCGYTCSHLPSLKSHMWKHASDPHFNYECTMSHIKHGKNNPHCTQNKKNELNDPLEIEISESESNENVIPDEAEYALLRYQCAQCGFVGATKDTLIKHIRAKHKESLNSFVSQ
ncbi:zinc finger protein 507-like [Anneissia japonica]|uniref:zinc finger protein 507-like n=1 Tax=Anneissia japonica TaxID=1529436 RepID=UPI001425983B|nr:zinc finger protein 507-like [Anneissia japonica]